MLGRLIPEWRPPQPVPGEESPIFLGEAVLRLLRVLAHLRGVFSATDLDGGDELITYYTIGGRACTAWFVLTYLLGRDRVRVYDGSWAEWGRMPEAPVEQA